MQKFINIAFVVFKIFKVVKCDALSDLVSFVQFEKRGKHPWRSVNFSKVAGFSLQMVPNRTTNHKSTTVSKTFDRKQAYCK